MNYYGHYRFFEDGMKLHNKVSEIKKIKDCLYKILLCDDRELKVFICDCYSFGLAEYLETVEIIGEIQVIIINSNWCGYSAETKLYCRKRRVGLFKINEFMAALNMRNYWDYLTIGEIEYYKKNGWL